MYYDEIMCINLDVTFFNLKELHVCLDGSVWKWCTPLDINKTTTQVRSVTSSDQNYSLVVSVSRLSNIQNQVLYH